MLKPEDFIVMPIPASRYEAVCALLGGASVASLLTTPVGIPGNANASHTAGNTTDVAPSGVASQSGSDAEASPAAATDAGASAPAGDDSGEIDAHGHPWSADMHAATKGKTKDGLWRMKVGVTRPAPLPGFPVESTGTTADTGTSSATEANSATSPAATEPASAPTATSTEADEDEFAAFREAAATSNATDDAAAAAAAATTREFSDADLGALCNQAAVKLGDPAPIKEIIAQFVPEGQVAHSRNIPAERRDDFAKQVEAKAGIEFAG